MRAGATPFTALATERYRRVTRSIPAAPCDIIYTSGTTGPPKGVLLTHDMLLRTAFGSAYARAFEDGRRILFSLPMYHVFGYVEGLLAVLFVGGAIIPQIRFDPVATLARDRAAPRDRYPAGPDDDARGDRCGASRRRSICRRCAPCSRPAGARPSGSGRRFATCWASDEITTGYGMTRSDRLDDRHPAGRSGGAAADDQRPAARRRARQAIRRSAGGW